MSNDDLVLELYFIPSAAPRPFQVLFSIYYYTLYKFVDGPCPIPPGNQEDLVLAFKRITKIGLAGLPQDGNDEETLDVSRPGSPAETIERLSPTDPRAIDFQDQFRNWCVLDPPQTARMIIDPVHPAYPYQVRWSPMVTNSTEGDVCLALLVSLL